MSRSWIAASLLALALPILPLAAYGSPAKPKDAAAEPSKTFDQAVEGFTHLDGLLPLYLDQKAGRILVKLRCSAAGDCGTYLYQVQMRTGLGSTPIGVDRSAPAETQLLVFRRSGKKVFAELQNTAFRAAHGSAAEQAAVRESFPPSTIWAGEGVAEAEDGGLLVDLTGFLTRDTFGVGDALRRAKQGAYHLDPNLSYADLGEAHAFPDNLELDAHQTFVADTTSEDLGGIAPDARAVTVISHTSFVRLPPPGFTPRLADPRVGVFSQGVIDYSAPLTEPTAQALAHRFRLEKLDPTAAKSPVKKPIIFYVDPAAPEPVRSALREGASWWAKAFEAAGFQDAFRVDVLPAGASPLDIRYNVINWVHRQTRGWSYGANIIDPRTGEIIKGSVLLGSLRVRQDRLILEGLVGADKTGTGAADDPIRVSLARLCQLAVHETGHALGLQHNFAGSTFDDRASVMDYPPPRVKLVAGEFDLSDAYQVGIGSWDRFAISWLYGETPPGQSEANRLDALVHDGEATGLRFVGDDDSRPTSAEHPLGALWDDGTDSINGLAHALEIRKIALARFGLGNIPKGAPVSDLRRVLVPLYLFHRYEVEAVAKEIGGVDFTYAVRGDTRSDAKPVSPEVQRRALSSLLQTLAPETLNLPQPLLNLLNQGRDAPTDHAFDVELFEAPDRPGFSLGAAAVAAADVTLNALLNPDRLNRVAEEDARTADGLQPSELVGKLLQTVFGPATASETGTAEINRRLKAHTIARLILATRNPILTPTPRAAIEEALLKLAARLKAAHPGTIEDIALDHQLARAIESQNAAEQDMILGPDLHVTPPPGMPI